MLTVREFRLPFIQENDEIEIKAPRGARVLGVGTQGKFTTIWALVDTDAPKVIRRFSARANGAPCDGLGSCEHVGTCRGAGLVVLHVFAHKEAP